MKAKFGVPTLSYWWRATPPVALSRAAGGPARSKNLGTHGVSMRENREVPWSPVPLMVGAGREGNADGGNPLMHDRGKSEGPGVPRELPNNAALAVAEVVEGRGPAEGNVASETRPGRRAGVSVSS